MHDRDLALMLLLLATAARSDGGGHREGGFVSRVASRATGAVVDMVDPDIILDAVDVDGIMERVDIDALLERVDVDALFDRIDVDALLGQVDVNALLDRIDIDRLMGRVDIEAIVARVDVKEVVDRAGIPDVVRESTGELAGSIVDVARRQLVVLDKIFGRFTYKITRRDPDTRPVAPPELDAGSGVDAKGRGQVAGHYAGGVSRLLAFVVDSLIVWVTFVLGAAGFAFVMELMVDVTVEPGFGTGVVHAVVLIGWGGTYMWVSLALAGRMIGMGIIGIRVVTRDGAPITGRQALVRTVVFPFSFLLFGFGFWGILFSPERRAMHDAAAGSVVVYDWGDRPAEMPAPFTRWLERHATED